MKTYLAALRKDIDIRKLEEELKKKNITLADYYKTVGVVKLVSGQPVSEKDFPEYFLSVEEDKNI